LEKETELSNEIINLLSEYPKARKMFSELYSNKTIRTYIDSANLMAVKRLGYNDHGIIHSLITTKNAILIHKYLTESLKPSVVSEGLGTLDDSLLVTVSAAYLHDIGHNVHREIHYRWSVILAEPLLQKILVKFYKEPTLIYILSHILHAIYTHDEAVESLTVEAGIVKIADGSDIAEGRSRIPFSLGKIDIHSVSALAVKRVLITRGTKKPVKIIVEMDNPAGIFQVEYILGRKMETSGLDQYIDLDVFVGKKEIHLSEFDE